MVGYKHSHSAASNGRASQATGVDSNLIPGGGTNVGGARVTDTTLTEESRLLDVAERVSSSSYAGTESGASDTATRDIRSDLNELEEGDEGVMEMGRDGAFEPGPPNSCRSSVSARFDLLFRILGPIGEK